jgi:hypothetical protein
MNYEPSYGIETWEGFDHFKYIMDNIDIGSIVIVSDDFDEDVDLRKCKVTEITKCYIQEEENVDAICQLCVGEIGLDGEEPECYHSDLLIDKLIATYIREIVLIEPIEFLKEDEMIL